MENSKEFTHGTRYGYKKAKCKCDLCREWNRLSSRKYDKRRKGKYLEHPRLPLSERVAEVEWLRGTDTLENIAIRLGWKSRESMLESLQVGGYTELAADLVFQETYARHGRMAQVLE